MAPPPQSPFAVGGRVRAPLPNHARATRRAVIATLAGSTASTNEDEDDATAVVIFEDDCSYTSDDVLLSSSSKSAGDNRQPFLIAPTKFETDENDEAEATLPLKSLSELLEFETSLTMETTAGEDASASPRIWKERGDALLRLLDHAAAVACYETALRGTSRIQIGGTVLVKGETGHVVAAEIDCIDGGSVDVSFVETGDEATVPKRKILLAAADPVGSDDHLQERILLNLARCMLKLAELTSTSSRRPQYLRAAVLGCTLVLALCSAQDGTGDVFNSSNLQISALLLRGQAQALLQKFAHAQADLKRLLALDPAHKEGRRQMQMLERQKTKVAKTNKRLAKDVSQWVQSVMQDQEHPEVVENPPSVSEDAIAEEMQDLSSSRKREFANAIPFWSSLITVVLLAWFVEKYFG